MYMYLAYALQFLNTHLHVHVHVHVYVQCACTCTCSFCGSWYCHFYCNKRVLSYDNWSPPKLVPLDRLRQNGLSPWTVHGGILGPPRTVHGAITCPPLLSMVRPPRSAYKLCSALGTDFKVLSSTLVEVTKADEECNWHSLCAFIYLQENAYHQDEKPLTKVHYLHDEQNHLCIGFFQMCWGIGTQWSWNHSRHKLHCTILPPSGNRQEQ